MTSNERNKRVLAAGQSESGQSEADTPPRRPDGFRERGQQVTRVEAFVDAAFAFAVTLLVISGTGDNIGSIPELTDALKDIPAFAASFAMVAMVWFAHHQWSRRFGLDDHSSVIRSLVLVFFVLVWIFPLRMMFRAAFAWVSGMMLPRDSALRIDFPFVLSREDAWGDLRLTFIIYALSSITLSPSIAGLYAHSWRLRDSLDLDDEERVGTRCEIARWRFSALVGALSIAIAIVLEPRAGWMWGLPGMAYFAMSFTGVVQSVAERRARKALPASTG